MEQIKNVLHALVPDFMQIVKQRSNVLHYIAAHQPVGRRALATHLALSERRLRTEIDHLRELHLVKVDKNGISLTALSQKLLPQLDIIFEQQERLEWVEQQLSQRFNRRYRVVPGDSEKQDCVYTLMAQVVTAELENRLPIGENIIAVTGGNTLAQVIPHISDELSKNRQFKIVPARGGGSGALTIQANILSYELATIVSGEATSLFVPERLSQALYESLLKDTTVLQTLSLLKRANCLIYSVGDASVMMDRRGVSTEEQQHIQQQHAVGEAMGTFFDRNGKIIHRLTRVGLTLEDLNSLPCEILIVGGAQKKQALIAYMKLAPQQTIIVVDEALAYSILKEETLEK